MVVSVVRALSVGSARSGVRACRACWPVVGLGFAAGGQPNSETTGSAQPSGPLQDRSSLPPTATPPSFSLSLALYESGAIDEVRPNFCSLRHIVFAIAFHVVVTVAVPAA